MDHLLLHYEISGALWNTIFNSVGLVFLLIIIIKKKSVGLVWIMPRRVVDLFAY